MNRQTSQLYNLLTVVFVGLTAFVCVCSLVLMVSRPAGLAPRVPTAIPIQVLPTDTVTRTPTRTLTPSRTLTPTRTLSSTPSPTPTELPPTATLTPSMTPTSTITVPPSRTPVPPTSTPTRRVTATRGPSPTRTPTATSAFAFSAEPTQITAFPNCQFQGVGGRVFSFNKQQELETTSGIQVNVRSTTGNFNQTVAVGSNNNYGWLVQVASAPNSLSYTVELVKGGVALSPKATITFPNPNSCTTNLGLVNFVQQKPF